MSASSHSFAKLPRGPDVLGELLHSLSQPLTGLRCSLELSLGLSLELSIEEIGERQQESVAIALQQTEKVIGMIQLMREYLDAEQPGPEGCPVPLAPVVRSVVGELSSIAAVRNIELRVAGTCTAMLPLPESRLRLALQYLIAAQIEAQPLSGKIMLLLREDPGGAVLRVDAGSGFHEPDCGQQDCRVQENSGAGSLTKRDRARAASASVSALTLRRVRLAIASRVLENAGASLAIGNGTAENGIDRTLIDPAGFVLRIPRQVGAPVG